MSFIDAFKGVLLYQGFQLALCCPIFNKQHPPPYAPLFILTHQLKKILPNKRYTPYN
jgi:hypothetical protein